MLYSLIQPAIYDSRLSCRILGRIVHVLKYFLKLKAIIFLQSSLLAIMLASLQKLLQEFFLLLGVCFSLKNPPFNHRTHKFLLLRVIISIFMEGEILGHNLLDLINDKL